MNISINDYRMMCAEREVSRQRRIQALRLPTYTFTEEMLNCLTHALGAVLGVVGFLLSMRYLLPTGNVGAAASMVGAAVPCRKMPTAKCPHLRRVWTAKCRNLRRAWMARHRIGRMHPEKQPGQVMQSPCTGGAVRADTAAR